MKKGEIYDVQRSKYSDCVHYVVCMEDCENSTPSFRACLITTKDDKPEQKYHNEPMKKSWFSSAKKYSIHYKNSHVVMQPIEKEMCKINFNKGVVGHLTKRGVGRVERLTETIESVKSNDPIWNM